MLAPILPRPTIPSCMSFFSRTSVVSWGLSRNIPFSTSAAPLLLSSSSEATVFLPGRQACAICVHGSTTSTKSLPAFPAAWPALCLHLYPGALGGRDDSAARALQNRHAPAPPSPGRKYISARGQPDRLCRHT